MRSELGLPWYPQVTETTQDGFTRLRSWVRVPEPLFDLERGPDPQPAIRAPRAGVDVGDGVGQEQVADLTIGRLVELDVVVGRAVEAHDRAAPTLGIAQVVQSPDNLVLPFGSTAPSSKIALAALVISSSSSSSLIRRRAWASGSAS